MSVEVEIVEQSRRGFPVYKANPFVHRVVLDVRQRHITFSKGDLDVVDKETGDYIAPATVGSYIQVEKEEFIKIYTREMGNFFDLSKVGTRMVGIIFRAVQQFAINKTEIFLPYKKSIEIFLEISENEKPFSKATYTRGINELLKKEFIAEHPNGMGWFYTNPNIFFNGDRVRFVREYCKTEEFKKVKAQLVPLKQGNLLEPDLI